MLGKIDFFRDSHDYVKNIVSLAIRTSLLYVFISFNINF